MLFLRNFFNARKLRKTETYADQQYLDALEIIKESMSTYLDLLAIAHQNNDEDMAQRLNAKLNSEFEYLNKSWDGEVRIVHTVTSTCSVAPNKKRLKL